MSKTSVSFSELCAERSELLILSMTSSLVRPEKKNEIRSYSTDLRVERRYFLPEGKTLKNYVKRDDWNTVCRRHPADCYIP